HSWEFLATECAITEQGPNNLPVTQVKMRARSDLNSGVGRGTGAASDFDAEWFYVANLPAGKSWTLSMVTILEVSNAPSPGCVAKVNDGTPKTIAPGPSLTTFRDLTGIAVVSVSCSQGHAVVFPSGPRPNTAI